MKPLQKITIIFITATLLSSLSLIWIFTARISKLQNEIKKCVNKKPEKTLSQNTVMTSNIDRGDTIYSPDKTMKVYLEKEFDPEIQRFIRQSVILENLKTNNKQILKEIITTPAFALVDYTEDGCNKDKSACCNSLIDFNEFEPMAWLTNDMIEINQYFDNYECAGQVTDKIIYNSKGEKYFNDELVKKFDYKTDEHTDEGWSIKETCADNDRIIFILEKNMFGGYSYLEYSKKDNKFINQYIQTKSNTANFSDFFINCQDIMDVNKVKNFFSTEDAGLGIINSNFNKVK